jgi:hypothetical protein
MEMQMSQQEIEIQNKKIDQLSELIKWNKRILYSIWFLNGVIVFYLAVILSKV